MAQHSGLLHKLFKPPKVQCRESLVLSQLDLKGKLVLYGMLDNSRKKKLFVWSTSKDADTSTFSSYSNCNSSSADLYTFPILHTCYEVSPIACQD